MSEQTTAANLDEVIETQMKQSESAWTRKTDGIDIGFLGKYEFWTLF